MSSQPKKMKVAQKFRDEYTRTWSFIKPSRLSDEHALCTICNTDIKISGGAKSDIEKHIKTTKHLKQCDFKESFGSLDKMWHKQEKKATHLNRN